MIKELCELLDLVARECVGQDINPVTLYPMLQLHGYLMADEVDLIEAKITTTQKHLILFQLLKAKSEDFFVLLQEIFLANKWFEILNSIQQNLKNVGKSYLIPLPKESRIKKVVDQDIQMGDKIGQGGFGIVYKAIYNGSTVAIKQFHVPNADSKLRDMIFREAEVLRSILHENILRYVSFVDRSNINEILLVTEFVDGGDMRRFITDGTLSEPEKKRISMSCWTGLAYLHGNNICHMDIKPENILISNDDKIVKIADFGLSDIKIKLDATRTSLKGTSMYFPPEWTGDEEHLDRTLRDVYSMGATQCELFSGHLFWSNDENEPLEATKVTAKLQKQLKHVRKKEKYAAVEPIVPIGFSTIQNTDVKNVLKYAINPDWKQRKSANDMIKLFQKVL